MASASNEGNSGGIAGGDPATGTGEVSADDLRQVVRVLGLVDIPEHLMPKVLEHVRTHRRSMRKLDESGIDLTGVVAAQPFRA